MNTRWLDDTLRYFGRDPIHRGYHHDEIVHHVVRAGDVHSLPDEEYLFGQMWGDDWQKTAHLRLVYTYQHSLAGTPRAQPRLPKTKLLVGDLERAVASEPALQSDQTSWIVIDDTEQSVFVYERLAVSGERVVVALNCTPVPRFNYRIGIRTPGVWRELLNSDADQYGGTSHGNLGGVEAAPVPSHDRPLSLNLTLPPLGALLLCPERQLDGKR